MTTGAGSTVHPVGALSQTCMLCVTTARAPTSIPVQAGLVSLVVTRLSAPTAIASTTTSKSPVLRDNTSGLTGSFQFVQKDSRS